MYKAKYTFIVPVYNVASYLEECLDSLLAQSFSDFQIVLVNDGSLDESGDICDKYASLDSRVSVIHQKNAGLSAARNVGVSNSDSEYIIFIDSDDYWLANNSLHEIDIIINESPNLEMLCFKRRYLYSNKKLTPPSREYSPVANITDVSTTLLSLLITEQLDCSACLKVVNKKFIEKHDLYFKRGLLSEDVEWFMRCILKLTSLQLAPISCYVYRCQREGSITNTVNIKNLQHILDTIESFYLIDKSTWHDSQKGKVILSFLAYQLSIVIGYYSKLNKKDKLLIGHRVAVLLPLLKLGFMPKVSKVEKLVGVFGYKIASYILSYYIFFRRAGWVGGK